MEPEGSPALDLFGEIWTPPAADRKPAAAPASRDDRSVRGPRPPASVAIAAALVVPVVTALALSRGTLAGWPLDGYWVALFPGLAPAFAIHLSMLGLGLRSAGLDLLWVVDLVLFSSLFYGAPVHAVRRAGAALAARIATRRRP